MIIEKQIPEYTVERLNAGNLAGVEKLHAAVYGKTPPKDFFFKKYDTAFSGVKYVGFIAYNRERTPIGYYGVIPCLMQFDEKPVLAAQSADTMTHPQYRFKGLFVELALLTYDLCLDEGINFVFGFPNQNSLPGFVNKLGWQKTETMDCFIIDTGAFPWKRILNKLSFLNGLYKSYQQKQLQKYILPQHGIGNSVLGDGFAGVDRDPHFLNYKSYTHTHVIKTGDSILWIKISSVILIGDIAVKPADFDNMIDQLKKLAKKLGIKEIHFHASPGTTLHGLFTHHFNSIPSFPVIFKDLEGDTPIDKIKFTSADIDTF